MAVPRSFPAFAALAPASIFSPGGLGPVALREGGSVGGVRSIRVGLHRKKQLRGSLREETGANAAASSCLAAAAAVLVAARLRKHDSGRAPRLQRRVQGDGVKFGGSWTTPTDTRPTESEQEMIRVKLPIKGASGAVITQIRLVHPAEYERYGEEYSLNQGSTDNCYLLTPKDAPFVLIGLHDGAYAQTFLEVLGEEDLARIGHICLSYFDGKQGDTLEALISARQPGSPIVQVHCSNPIKVALTKGLSQDILKQIEIVSIRGSHSLTVEEDRVLKFMLTPTPKLPEAVVIFDPLTGTLFCGKFFSAHRALDKKCAPFDKKGRVGWEAFSEDWFHLFDNYFFTATAQKAIRRIFMLAEALTGPDVQLLAPMHGPVVRDQCWKLMAKYEAWTEKKLRKEDRRDTEVLVMYASAYGHTKSLAVAIEKGLRTSGVRAKVLNLEHCSVKDVVAALDKCNGFCIGSPTLGGEMPTQVKEALGAVLHAGSSEASSLKPCGVFGSYGWSGEAVDEMQFRLKDGGFPLAFDPIRVKFRPTVEALALCEEAGVKMAQKMQKMLRDMKKRRVRKIETVKQSGAATEAFQKMRISQAVFAAKHKDNGSDIILPLSWLNQASFDPPGISMSVPKGLIDQIVETDTLEQTLDTIWAKVDADGNGTLDRDETTEFLKEIGLVNDIDDVMNMLHPDGDGAVTREDMEKATLSGPLAERIVAHQRMISVERELLKAAKGNDGIQFTVSIIPDSVPLVMKELSQRIHPKAKPANGCVVLQDSHAYLEGTVLKTMECGGNVLLYCKIVAGKVFADNDLTNMVSNENGMQMDLKTLLSTGQEAVPA